MDDDLDAFDDCCAADGGVAVDGPFGVLGEDPHVGGHLSHRADAPDVLSTVGVGVVTRRVDAAVFDRPDGVGGFGREAGDAI